MVYEVEKGYLRSRSQPQELPEVEALLPWLAL
jgi:hypothetical protein